MKILISVGCDAYVHDKVPPLYAAENDAREVYKALVEADDAIYDKSLSRLLCSPTCFELKDVLQEAIFWGGDVEISFFFAGHGGIKDGAYFLCAKDTNPDRLTVSSLGLTELFLWINEARVNDTNIVIDACESGGVAYDVTTFLKPRQLGVYGSPSLSVLAASASNQSARERDGQGVATSALLKCLRGDVWVSSAFPTLTLFEVGFEVSEMLEKEVGQASVSWGLNLFGRPRFCANPNYSRQACQQDIFPVGVLDATGDASVISAHTESVWELYLKSSRSIDLSQFLRLTQRIVNDLGSESRSASAVIDGLARTFLNRLSQPGGSFEKAELLGACIASLLPFSSQTAARDAMRSLSRELVANVDCGIQELLGVLESDSSALLSPRSMLGDLYFLPIRILRILGWAGAATLIASDIMDHEFNAQFKSRFGELIGLVLGAYVGSVVSVSDEQACPLLTFLRAANYCEFYSEAEEVFGLMCHSLHEFGGQVSEPNLSGEDAFYFTRARSKNAFSGYERLVSNPSELISVIFLSARKMSFEDIVDGFIADFDHLPGNMFVPDTYASFAQERIEEGTNFSYRIGHGVWRASDFDATWDLVESQIGSDNCLRFASVRVGALCSALVQPDRTPWFLWAALGQGDDPFPL
jgi:hypothetical protein